MPNERLIYEWLGYKDAQYFETSGWLYLSDGQIWKDCPPLDMNTAFAEAIPKLVAEGCPVDCSVWKDKRGEFTEWSLNEDQFVSPDFWQALTDYLEAKDA